MPGTFLLPEQHRQTMLAALLRSNAEEMMRNFLASQRGGSPAMGAGVQQPMMASGPTPTNLPPGGALSSALGAMPPMAAPPQRSMPDFFRSREFTSADPAQQTAARRLVLGQRRQV